MDVAFERISSHPIVTAISCILLYILFIRLTTPTALPKGLPWVGKQSDRLFSETWACLMSIRNSPNLLRNGYEKVPLHTLPFVHW